MLLLALSTSGPIASAALLRDGVLLGMRAGGKGTHSETILPLVEALLTEYGLAPADMDAFGADIGPGSFTGVRIGVCIVNAMAAAHRKPVVGVSALAALCHGISGPACALLDARNGNVYGACYENDLCTLPPQSMGIEEFLGKVSDGVFIGDGADAYFDLIHTRVCKCAVVEKATPTAAAVAELAYAMYLRGETATEAMPLYLRPSQAERLFAQRQEMKQ